MAAVSVKRSIHLLSDVFVAVAVVVVCLSSLIAEGASPVTIPESIARRISAPVPFSRCCCGRGKHCTYRISRARRISQSSGKFLQPFLFVYLIAYESKHQQFLFHFLGAAVDDSKQILTICRAKKQTKVINTKENQ